tara:strand:+ start:130 stop:546 length:417 start_codon:yes stop_codon:yes gene_type:complete
VDKPDARNIQPISYGKLLVDNFSTNRKRIQMNLNEQLRQAYQAGRRQGLNEQKMASMNMPSISTRPSKMRVKGRSMGMMNTQQQGASGPSDPPFDQYTLERLLAAWGTNNPAYDFNGDGIVDGADLGILLGQGGMTAG